MAVYREGYHIMEEIRKRSIKIYPDACGYGVPTKKGDVIWNMMKQLAEWYGEKDTRKAERYGTGRSVGINITLIDEWAVSDGRKTEKEATDKFIVSFVSCTDGACRGFDGFVCIYIIDKE